MTILENISLKSHNTFGIDVKAKHFININSQNDLEKALKLNEYPQKFVLGGGSNMLLTKDIDALVMHVNNKGIEIVKENEKDVLVKVQAGENWHEFVLWCIENDFGGVENLSLIPGNVGTAPIQNIGAYGVELKDVFIECEAIKIVDQTYRIFTNDECNFGYRNSIFKNDIKGEYIITNVIFKLSKSPHTLNTSYGAIKSELENQGISIPSIKNVSDAVISIRQSKLPDPNEIGNSGSFFKNPVISMDQFKFLKENFPEIPSYKVSDSFIKIPAGWLIEKAGFKGKKFGNYGVHKNQALVLVNYGNADGNDILKLSILIQNTIKRLFNIDLEAEVNVF